MLFYYEKWIRNIYVYILTIRKINNDISKQISTKKYEYHKSNLVLYNMYKLIHGIGFNKLYLPVLPYRMTAVRIEYIIIVYNIIIIKVIGGV